MEVGTEVASWLKETRSFCSNNLKSCVVPDRSNEAAFNRLARQRQRWLSGFILRLAPLKFVPEDIPAMDETDGWEWDENETRLLSIVKNRRNARLSPLLQGKQPPAACDGRLEPQISPDTSVSCSAKDILRSPLADDVWRQARASIGLKSKFPGWTERSFVHYAINRTCTYCSSEGLTLWAFAATMCGDCFGRRVMDLRDVSAVFSGPIRDSVPAAWVTGVKRDSLLVSKDYLEAVQTWATSFPDYARNMIPEDEFGRHIRIQNAQFMKVAEDGIKWQKDRDRRRNHMRKSREKLYVLTLLLLSIANKLQAHAPPIHASQKVRCSSKWEAIVDKQYPLSELEWNRIERSVLAILGVHKVDFVPGRN
ncbi:hypothetical protein M407DRAFT_9685 [Tulasnella calospora MUT 4182]|uniref:Uncharacterized protein n=1 Tax=Tulasnella calospora MUT 4182 TaxID=1051891 RepID=A0A0C3QDM8_9AGAM|nr:hypothetical protein M407DRAFT_9685 [Tulasnella calospora MUT 4182]